MKESYLDRYFLIYRDCEENDTAYCSRTKIQYTTINHLSLFMILMKVRNKTAIKGIRMFDRALLEANFDRVSNGNVLEDSFSASIVYSLLEGAATQIKSYGLSDIFILDSLAHGKNKFCFLAEEWKEKFIFTIDSLAELGFYFYKRGLPGPAYLLYQYVLRKQPRNDYAEHLYRESNRIRKMCRNWIDYFNTVESLARQKNVNKVIPWLVAIGIINGNTFVRTGLFNRFECPKELPEKWEIHMDSLKKLKKEIPEVTPRRIMNVIY